MTIRLPPEIESRLRSEASRRGVDVSQYACDLIADHLPPGEHEPSGEVELFAVRGVIAHLPAREELFTRTISVRINDLPQWKPQVVLGRRVMGESYGE